MSSQSDIQSTCCEYEVEIKDNITTVKIPETYDDKPLTEDQREMLLKFEEEFINRYTDDDNDYVITVKLGNTTPPLVPSYRPFWNRRRDNRLKRNWDDDQKSYNNKRYKNHHHNDRPNYGYNNDYRR